MDLDTAVKIAASVGTLLGGVGALIAAFRNGCRNN